MNPISIISASAGSGKTHRLSEELERALTDGNVRPESIVAMTFTKKAAGELHERVRQYLIKRNRHVDAQRLGAARIGTVNAVCGKFVSDFAFELGLSPDLQVLDEDATAKALQNSLSSVLDDHAKNTLSDLCSRMGDRPTIYSSSGFDWQREIRQIVELARANGIEANQLPAFAAQSKAQIGKFLLPPLENGAELDANLVHALIRFLEQLDGSSDETKVTLNAIADARRALIRLQNQHTLEWKEWVSLSRLMPAKKSVAVAAAQVVQEAAAKHDVHPRLQQDLDNTIDLIFELAQHALESYQQYKVERGVIDYIDQETYVLHLLSKDDIQRQLQSQIDLVLVDEFQDTSPIQLAIFLRLAEISRQNIWVGDQKQSIYAFRGADPSLMDTVIDTLLGGREPTTLDKSWRSRPALVTLTSDLFAPAFEQHGIPESRVRLKPANPSEPPGLGPIIECWKLQSKNAGDDALSLADTLRQMLQDPSVQIRDRITNQARPVRASDIAVLCRKNATCSTVAQSLQSLGIRAILPRIGLTETTEGRVILAGLRFWADSRDSLAVAELARFLAYPEADTEWLSAMVERPPLEAFKDIDFIAAMARERQAHMNAGPVEVIDRIMGALDVIGLCRRWGNTTTRLANVEAFRNHVLSYVEQRSGAGAACTLSGLVRHLMKLADDKADAQGVNYNQDAVTVCTWHGAKGLEWPVTVLYELQDRVSEWPIRGVNVATERRDIDLSDPLADRWIRYLPYPYADVTKNVPFLDRLGNSTPNQLAKERQEREQLRLLYVAWTRARDRVVLAGRQGSICSGILNFLNTGGTSLIHEPDEETITWAGQSVKVVIRKGSPQAPAALASTPDVGYPVITSKTYPPAFRQPSADETSGEIGQLEQIGERIVVGASADWDFVGSALHGFLAVDRADLSQDIRLRIANRIRRSWFVERVITSNDMLLASDRLRTWATTRWPGAAWKREWPICMRTTEGTVVRGQVDMILETDESCIVIDHKSFPGSIEQAQERARACAGQLRAYKEMIYAATGKPVTAAFIHLPISGILFPTV